jgi:hypothetical protein
VKRVIKAINFWLRVIGLFSFELFAVICIIGEVKVPSLFAIFFVFIWDIFMVVGFDAFASAFDERGEQQ